MDPGDHVAAWAYEGNRLPAIGAGANVAPPVVAFNRAKADAGYSVASRDGSELYVFDGQGRQVKTLDGLTSTLKYALAYDANGFVSSVTDRNGLAVRSPPAAHPTNAPNGEADGVVVSANGSSTTATAAHFWPFIVLSTAEAKNAGIMV